jgi:hypothetical protein
VAPSPFANVTPIEVTDALQHNQLILVSLAVTMNPSSQLHYTENGKLGWQVPSLKQLFTTAVSYIKKFKNGIISSWEGYTDNHVSILCLLRDNVSSNFVGLTSHLALNYDPPLGPFCEDVVVHIRIYELLRTYSQVSIPICINEFVCLVPLL